MCGLIGFTGNKNKKANRNFLKQIMKANDSRGGHSTGYFDGEFFTKVVGKSPLLSKEIDKLNTNVFIGHTRYATHGVISCPNQHPFQYGNIVGAHNGVLNNYVEVGEELGQDETEVDSQMIFKALNVAQNSGDQYNVLGMFSGTLATIYTDTETGLVYTYRNGNPLFVGRDKHGSAYFSSLKPILEKLNLKGIFELKEERVYVWKGAEIIERIDIDCDPVYSVNNYNTRNWNDYSNDWWYPATHPNKKDTKISTSTGWSRSQGKFNF